MHCSTDVKGMIWCDQTHALFKLNEMMTHPKPFANHAGEDEGHDLVQVGLQLHCLIAHQAAQCL